MNTEDLKHLTAERDRLLAEKAENHETILKIRVQLEAAQAKQAEGVWDNARDPSWKHRATIALRHCGRADQRLAAELAEVNRKIRAHNYTTYTAQQLTFERLFLRVARERLSDAVYSAIMAETYMRLEADPPVDPRGRG